MSLFYLIVSTLAALKVVPIEQEHNIWSKIVVTSFVMAINLQIAVTIFFWYWEVLYVNETMTYSDVFDHTILIFFTAIDGYVFDRIPIRLRQIVWVYPIPFLYLIWTIIHGLSGVGNPWLNGDDDETEDDDAIYSIINWKVRSQMTGIVVSVLFLVALPFFFTITWLLSFIPRRRYL